MVETIACDLADLDSVRQVSESIAASGVAIDYFIANAGVVRLSSTH